MSNEELRRCHYHLQIPAAAEYGSLNLAMAVQVVAYELYQAFAEVTTVDAGLGSQSSGDRFGEAEALLRATYEQHAAEQAGFLDADNPGQTMTRLRRLLLPRADGRDRGADPARRFQSVDAGSWRDVSSTCGAASAVRGIVDQITGRYLHTPSPQQQAAFMRLTTKGRYAVTAMLDIALHGRERAGQRAGHCPASGHFTLRLSRTDRRAPQTCGACWKATAVRVAVTVLGDAG